MTDTDAQLRQVAAHLKLRTSPTAPVPVPAIIPAAARWRFDLVRDAEGLIIHVTAERLA